MPFDQATQPTFLALKLVFPSASCMAEDGWNGWGWLRWSGYVQRTGENIHSGGPKLLGHCCLRLLFGLLPAMICYLWISTTTYIDHWVTWPTDKRWYQSYFLQDLCHPLSTYFSWRLPNNETMHGIKYEHRHWDLIGLRQIASLPSRLSWHQWQACWREATDSGKKVARSI